MECKGCNKILKSNHGNKKYCNETCYKISRRSKPVSKRCNLCNNSYVARGKGMSGQRYCSDLCRHSYNIISRYGDPKELYPIWNIEECPICEREIHSLKNKHVDHCHKTGKIRGVICQKCNHGLGSFRDSSKILSKAISYLKDSR